MRVGRRVFLTDLAVVAGAVAAGGIGAFYGLYAPKGKDLPSPQSVPLAPVRECAWQTKIAVKGKPLTSEFVAITHGAGWVSITTVTWGKDSWRSDGVYFTPSEGIVEFRKGAGDMGGNTGNYITEKTYPIDSPEARAELHKFFAGLGARSDFGREHANKICNDYVRGIVKKYL